jgi:internalin A
VESNRESRSEPGVADDGGWVTLTFNHGGTASATRSQLEDAQRLQLLLRRSPARLPDWFADLPNLREIDVRTGLILAMPRLPRVRWALNPEVLLRAQDLINPARVYSMWIDETSSAQALDCVVELARAGRLSLTELRVAADDEVAPDERRRIGSAVDEILAGCLSLETIIVFLSGHTGITKSVRNLRRLRVLRYAAVRQPEIPSWVFELPELTELEFSDAGLTTVPPSLERAEKLTTVNLSGNPLTRIPEAVWRLPRLESLNVRGCLITEIPAGILRLNHLQEIEIDPAELVVPPPEVVARGMSAIRSYWQEEQASGMDYLTEAKLLLVGEAGAGKTSLMRKILDSSYRLDPGEESTQGIDVRDWRFPAAVRVDGARPRERTFRVNIWDFGGQEIYHATHQFFLTKRSVYVLVSDGRREDADFQYWLDIVKLLSDGSPLIVVQNRKQGRGQVLDIGVLRQGYPHVVEQIDVNLADNSGLWAVIDRARRELELLPHIGTPLPKTWQRVRTALEDDSRNYIAADEFFRVCRDAGFQHEDDMRQLGGFLHDLGICLYFQDDPLLRHTVILKPEWGTTAVYRLLDDKAVSEAHGVFGPADLERLWPEPTFRAMRDELVQLMVRFSLCFPVPDSDRYVAPQLLSPSRPADAWDEAWEGTTLRYEYAVMPKGIVRRLIVALHDLIEEDLVWRHGVVVLYEHGRAEVVEDFYRRRLTIRLAGDFRGVLALIDRELNAIHRAYPDLPVERLCPCNCAMCGASVEPTMFRVRDLEDFARTGDHIQCLASRKLVDPVGLLNELWRPASPVPGSRVPEIFISYKWGGAPEQMADEIDAQLSADGMRVMRDKREIPYKDSIERFMRRLGGGKFVVVVLDDAYLRSHNCMFELTELAGRGDFARRVYPVVLPGADIYEPIGRIDYVRYWEEKIAELEKAMSGVSPQFLDGIRKDLDLYAKIRNTVAGITDVLRDMNTVRSGADADGFGWLSRMIAEAHTREAG